MAVVRIPLSFGLGHRGVTLGSGFGLEGYASDIDRLSHDVRCGGGDVV